MNLRILLPFMVFIDIKDVSSIILETSEGAYGLLPQRLDCVAALVPGIFAYETENKEIHYLAVDKGILIKAGTQVLVSVRNAIGNADLGKLAEMVKKDFKKQDESEREARAVMAKLESGFLFSFDQFSKQ